MSLRLGSLYDALLAAQGVSPEDAKKAAEEVAGYDKDLGRLRIEVRAQSVLLTVLVGAVFYVLNVVMQLHQQLAVMQQTLAAIAAKVGTL
jgi:hypothetical protein